MPVICISSPQGGSGRTMLTANLASAYAHRGNKVLLVDLNLQNTLKNHFNLTLVGSHGFVPYLQSTNDWGQFILKVDTNVYLLPYGDVTWKQHEIFQNLISHDVALFQRNFTEIIKSSGLVVIIDTPVDAHAVMHALDDMIDLQIVTLLADGAAPALLEKIEDRVYPGLVFSENKSCHYVINKTDPRYEMSHDIEVYLRQRIGDKLLGDIHHDSSVQAAFASQKLLRDYRPSSAALFDIESIEKKISQLLNISVGSIASPNL